MDKSKQLLLGSYGQKNEEESLEDQLSLHQETRSINICDDIKEEVKEEESVYDPLSIQEGRMEIDNICSEVKEEGIIDDTQLYFDFSTFE